MTRHLFFVAASLTLTLTAYAQPAPALDEAGRPFFTCFNAREHGGAFQTWAFEQDERGILYAANNLGVLEYDGAAWRLIETSSSISRTLARDADGRLYVGAFADFGYLAPDAAGQLRYVSLLDYVPEEERAFNDVWTIHPTDHGVYVQARERLFRFTPDGDGWTVKVWQPQERFMYAFWVGGVYYVHQSGVGLMKMVGDELELLPGGDLFANDRMQVMLPFDTVNGRERLLMGAFSMGLFLYDGRTFTPFPTEADALIRTSALYKGVVLTDGTFGLLTTEAGFFIVDRFGRMHQHMDQSTGLMSSTMYAAYVDRAGQLWLAPNNGICQVEIPAPLSRYDEDLGLTGAVYSIQRHRNTLYLATESGVYYLHPQTGHFELVTGIVGSRQAFQLLDVDGELLAGTNGGVYRIEGAQAVMIRSNTAGDFTVLVLHRSRQDPNRVFVGLGDGLASLRREGSGRWVDEGRLEGFHEYLIDIVEPEPGLLWLGASGEGVLRVRFADASPANPTIEHFGSTEGLGGDDRVGVSATPSGPVFATPEGAFRFDEVTGRFTPDSLLNNIVGFGGSGDEYALVEDESGNLWVNFGQETALLRRQADGAYQLDKTALLRFADMPAYAIYPEADGVVWFGGAEGLIRFDPGVEKDYAADFPLLIRRVSIGEDSTLYGGAARESGDGAARPAVAYAHNAMRFAYAALSYENPLENRYQSMLEGFDDHWSAWTTENRRDYTNLPPGDYTFRVRARNVYAHESAEATFAFRMLPPWYRTWWAYLLYAALVGGFVVGLVRQRTRHLEARQRELEQTVEERTAEIQQRVEELAVINSVQEGLVRELEMQAIYDLVGDRLRDLFDAQVVVIRTYDHEAGVERYRYAIEKGQRFDIPPQPIDGVRRHLIENKAPLFINEKFVETIQPYAGRSATNGDVPKSAIYVPMIVGETVRGDVSLQNVDREHAFSESDLRLLTTLVNGMSVALENARLFDETNRLLGETEQRAAELNTVNHISRALVAQLEFDVLVQLVGEQMRETFQASIVYVALHDKATDMIHFPYEYGDENPSRPFGSGLTEKIITTREPLLINRDLEEVRDQLQAQQIGKVSMSYLGVPIVVGEEGIGVISVQSTEEEGRFDEDDLRLLNTIAANVGVALQNAEAYRKLNAALEHLRATQEQLVQQEKLASLGALTAGIAHEIKNPLNFVNNFAQLCAELTDELGEELDANKEKTVAEVEDELKEILASLKINASKIEEHGRRADGIVRSMLQHSRGTTGERQAVDLNALLDEYVNLAYHGMRAQIPDFNVTLERDYDEAVGAVEAVPQELGQVFINLLNNAFYAVHEKADTEKKRRGDAEKGYPPTVAVTTRRNGGAVEIRLADNGPGIPKDFREKIFEPFFTTKPTGSGTGLGLSLSYDIITQRHRGALTVESAEGEGATFIIALPLGKSTA